MQLDKRKKDKGWALSWIQGNWNGNWNGLLILGSSDPYVRVFFMEEPSKSERTKVHRRNLSPKFHETLSFPGLYFTYIMIIIILLVLVLFQFV